MLLGRYDRTDAPRRTDTTATLRFCADDDTRTRLAAIVAAESRCCASLTIDLHDDAASPVLTIEAPDDDATLAMNELVDALTGTTAATTSGSWSRTCWPQASGSRCSCACAAPDDAERGAASASVTPARMARVTGRSIALFLAAALAEIGGAYLVWIGIKEHKGALVVALGIVALGVYGVVAAMQPSNEFGRVLAAYGGVFIIGSMIWAIALDGFRPDRADLIGATLCLAGVGVIMYAR